MAEQGVRQTSAQTYVSSPLSGLDGTAKAGGTKGDAQLAAEHATPGSFNDRAEPGRRPLCVPFAGHLRQRDANMLRRIQMILQLPDTALNPRHAVRDILGCPVESSSAKAAAR